MLKPLLFILICFAACNSKQAKPENQFAKPVADSTNGELKINTRFNYFDTTVDVVFWDTKDSISEIQKKTYEGFISKQDILAEEVLKKIFAFYKESYYDYKKGWKMTGHLSDAELEKYLPVPTTPENLRPYINPVSVYIQNRKDCKEGTLGIEFDCTWDIKSGLGVSIKNWKDIEAGVAEISYFLP